MGVARQGRQRRFVVGRGRMGMTCGALEGSWGARESICWGYTGEVDWMVGGLDSGGWGEERYGGVERFVRCSEGG